MILSDSSKFDRHGLVSLFSVNHIDTLDTDSGIKNQMQQGFEKKVFV